MPSGSRSRSKTQTSEGTDEEDRDEGLDMNDSSTERLPPVMNRTKSKLKSSKAKGNAEKVAPPPARTPKRGTKVFFHGEPDSEDDEDTKKRPSKKSKGDGGDPPDSSNDPDDSDDDDDSSTSSEEGGELENKEETWKFFVEVCKLKEKELDQLKELGFTAEDFDDLELLGSADPIDLSVLADDGDITHAKALRIGAFARFLHLRGDFRKHRTLPLMARCNAKTKSLRRDDNSDDDTKGMLKPSSVPVIPAFSNVAEDFEDYWAAVEGCLRQSHLGECLDAAPSKNARGRARNENKSLHWVLYEAFRDTDVEHIIQEAARKHKESGHHSHKLILNYYRSDDRIAEVQRRLRNKISALRFDGSDSSVASIQAHTNDFKMLCARLKLAKEVWKDAKLKQEYLRNIQLAGDHPLMVIKTICSSDDKCTFKKTIQRLLRTDGQDSLEQNEQQSARARRVNDSSTQGSNAVPKHTRPCCGTRPELRN